MQKATGRSSGSSCCLRWRVRLGRIGLQGGCRERIERADGLGEGEDLAVHQALVKLVQVKQLRLLRVPGLQQVGGQGHSETVPTPAAYSDDPSPK